MEVRQRRALSGRRCRFRVVRSRLAVEQGSQPVDSRAWRLKEGRGREAGRSATEEGVVRSSSSRRRLVVASSSSRRRRRRRRRRRNARSLVRRRRR
eukprot:815234-Prymnesium_polylepis.1